jgi:copper chaperone CopZ
MLHHMQLATILDLAGVNSVLNALRAVPGVDAIEASAGSNRIAVRFDEGRTSVQELGAVLERSGFPAPQRRHAGACCGSCGG